MKKKRPLARALAAPAAANSLRRDAERRLPSTGRPGRAPSPAEAGALLHELEVHRVELELQNEELRRTRDELEASYARYFELYDLAPAGHATLSPEGIVLEGNLTLASWLGVPRGALVGQPLSRFVDAGSANAYRLNLRRLFEMAAPASFEVDVVTGDGRTFWGKVDAAVHDDASSGTRSCRIVLTRVTDHAAAALAALSEGVVLQFAGGQIATCNPAAELILGLTRNELMGRTSLDPRWQAIHEDGSPFPGETHPVAMTLRTGQAFRNVVMGVRRPDGALRWLSVNSAPIHGPSGSPSAAVATFVDVTARKRAEEALAASEHRFRLLAQNATDAIGVLDPDGVIRYTSPSCKAVIGYDQSEMIGRRVADLYHPDDLPSVERAVARHAAGESLVRVRYRMTHKDGRTIWVERVTRAVRNRTTGEVTELQFSVRDVTEAQEAALALQRERDDLDTLVGDRTASLREANEDLREMVAVQARIEKELRESEERHRLLFENSLDAILLTIPEGGILAANPAACRMFGRSEEEICAGGRASILDQSHPAFRRMLEERTRTGTVRGEMAGFRAGGERFPVEVVSAVFRAGDGQPLTATILHDLSSRKSVETERERLLERVRLLAARASDAREAEARRLARELHDKVGQGLTALGLNIGRARGSLTVRGLEAAPFLDEASSLVEKTVAEVRAVMADLRPPALDDLGLVPALRLSAEKLARLGGFAVRVSGTEPSPRFSPAVEIALFRIGQEALTNVARHSRARSAAVSLSRMDGKIRLVIEDDGVGFEPALVPRSGSDHLGLVGMRERAEAMRGELTVGSEPGAGTAIVLELPEPAS